MLCVVSAVVFQYPTPDTTPNTAQLRLLPPAPTERVSAYASCTAKVSTQPFIVYDKKALQLLLNLAYTAGPLCTCISPATAVLCLLL